MKQLLLGGARSGKSALAERLAAASGLPVTYIATATPGDSEMAVRIQHHRVRRPGAWETAEVPLRLSEALQTRAAARHCLLVDCLTLWLTNWLLRNDDLGWRAERAGLLQALPELPGEIILVSNETGSGVVPMGALSRRFVDEAGWLHQDIAQRCDRVI
ncbi:MAG TPA: bifunctional adenosylcobinamide kinase/adenosylcobinamide-phosphate guanylyltransferase, partial [Chromatiales bacterium]|nr:bifunctional adenosylcobinamide kinase/adenosylcobinamide-phosphate guanylyltransferase [Chromatiales bacterium]